jgi:hypothetical protein
MDDEIRQLLRKKADEVPRRRAIPVSLTRRVRLRIARNSVALGTMIVLLAAGTFVGARALNAPGSHEHVRPASSSPRASNQPASPTSTPPASPTTCTPGQLRAVGIFEGAAGSREGAISLTNLSDVTCTLQGNPQIALLDANQNPITSGIAFSSSPAGWEVNASPTPPGWPLVTLAPGQAASIRIRWSNWCPDGRVAPLWQVIVPDGGSVNVNGDSVGSPPCNGQGQPSTIEVGPYEPAP